MHWNVVHCIQYGRKHTGDAAAADTSGDEQLLSRKLFYINKKSRNFQRLFLAWAEHDTFRNC